MVLSPCTAARGRSMKMGMLLVLIFFGCFQCIAANSTKVSETEIRKQSSNVANSTHQFNPTARNSRALAQFVYSGFLKDKAKSNDEQTPKSESESKSIYLIPQMRPGKKRNNNLLIPTLRYGRSDSSMIPNLRYGKSDSSMIPNLRFGRSVENEEESESFTYPENEDVGVLDGEDEMASLLYSGTSNLDDSLVKKRDNGDNIIKNENTSDEGESKRQSNDTLIPQMRYGRDSSEIDLPDYYILSNMRPGRSLKAAQSEKEKSSPYGLVPYPRPGRMVLDSEGFTIKELLDAIFTSSGQFKKQNVEEFLSSADKDLLFLEYPKDLKDLDKSEHFVIPYPRPGKRDSDRFSKEGKSNGHLFKVKSKEALSEYVLPYPRPGKRESLLEKSENTDNIMNLNPSEGEGLASSKRSQSENVIPYPRPGRNVGKGNLIPQFRFGRSSLIVPYPRPGKKSDSITPYPRPGRSDSLLPNLRFGRSDSVIPNMRYGRSDSILPNLRFGRSNSVIPNLRFGRSDSVIPNIRFGRSDSVIPNIRFGRSDSILPNLRFGRSDTILPNLRFGRSNEMLPYPRPGRSSDMIPYPRLGRSESIVPYPRPGRSSKVLPYPRRYKIINNNNGDSGIEYEDTESLDYILNVKEEEEHLPSKEKPNPSKKETERVLSDSVYLLPYPRPGRKV